MAGPVGPRTAMGHRNPHPGRTVLKNQAQAQAQVQVQARAQKQPVLANGPVRGGGPAPLACAIPSRPVAGGPPTRRWNTGSPACNCGWPSGYRSWLSASERKRIGGVASTYTVDKYIRLARSRMVEELIDNRLVHQAEQIYALMDCARRAAEAEQFSAAVGAHRVIAEISGMLRSPIKPPGERP